MNATADKPNWRWIVPTVPVGGIAHAYDLPPGDIPIAYQEPACGISTILNEDSVEDRTLCCGDCLAKVGK